jgi:hypothetical protein
MSWKWILTMVAVLLASCGNRNDRIEEDNSGIVGLWRVEDPRAAATMSLLEGQRVAKSNAEAMDSLTGWIDPALVPDPPRGDFETMRRLEEEWTRQEHRFMADGRYELRRVREEVALYAGRWAGDGQAVRVRVEDPREIGVESRSRAELVFMLEGGRVYLEVYKSRVALKRVGP